MKTYNIIFNSNGVLIQKYIDIESVYLEKFKYFIALIKYSASNILIVEYDKINAMKDILDTIKKINTDTERQRPNITFEEYEDALNYLGCEISIFNFYVPLQEEYDVFTKIKSDSELNYFIQKYCEKITENNIRTYLNKNNKPLNPVNDYYKELVSAKNYNAIEYLLTDIISNCTRFEQLLPNLDFFMECDKNFSDKYPAIWWTHLLKTLNLNGVEEYIDTILMYSECFVKYSSDLISEEIANKLYLKYGKKYDFLLEKISITNTEILLQNTNVNLKLFDLDKLVELFIRSDNINLVTRIAKYIDDTESNRDLTYIFSTYSNVELENRFNFLLNKIKDIDYICKFVYYLNSSGIPGSYSFCVNKSLFFGEGFTISLNKVFRFSENFFEFFSKFPKIYGIEILNFNASSKIFLKTDCSFLQSPSSFVCNVSQPEKSLGPEISTDYINLFDRQIQCMFVQKNAIILEPYGHITILENSCVRFYTKLKNFNLFYFANEHTEKIVLIYNNKIKIYNSKNMFYYALCINEMFYKFINAHKSFEL